MMRTNVVLDVRQLPPAHFGSKPDKDHELEKLSAGKPKAICSYAGDLISKVKQVCDVK